MRGIVLAGGTGSRLDPMTRVTNKHLLPVYNRPMILYPIETLVDAGVSEIMIVSGKGHAGHFLELLSRGENLSELLKREVGEVAIHYAVQPEAGGIAQALGLTRSFGAGHDVAVILGDNIYEETPDVSGFAGGARVFLKRVEDPKRFGVATLDDRGNVLRIVEKPDEPESDFAVTGFYLYDKDVYGIVDTLKPSARKELEITDVNNAYVRAGKMDARLVEGFWSDAGTVESLYRASALVHDLRQRADKKV